MTRKQTRDLAALTIREDATILQALQVIDRGGIEITFVVDATGRVVGTLSDGDVRRAILRGSPLDRPGVVADAMRRDFTSVGADVHRAEVLDMMRHRNISQVPALDADGRMIGLHLMRELLGATERDNAAVIMAGGQGVRLRPLTESLPKPMLPVAGRPILERLVLHLVGYGIRDVYISVNYLGSIIEEHFGDGGRFGCRVRYLREESPLGTGGAIGLLPEPINAPVLVVNGDLVTQADIDAILTFHENGRFVATSCLRPYQIEVPFGVADMDGDRLVAIREKPTYQALVNAGIYVLSPEAVRLVPKQREYPMTELLATCLERGLPVGAHVLEGDWLDVGRPTDLSRARGTV